MLVGTINVSDSFHVILCLPWRMTKSWISFVLESPVLVVASYHLCIRYVPKSTLHLPSFILGESLFIKVIIWILCRINNMTLIQLSLWYDNITLHFRLYLQKVRIRYHCDQCGESAPVCANQERHNQWKSVLYSRLFWLFSLITSHRNHLRKLNHYIACGKTKPPHSLICSKLAEF